MTLEGARVVIVGGSSGIGLGAAAAAFERGADVVLVGRSPERLQSAKAQLGGGPRVTVLAADITREADAARLFAEVGAFDHLIVTSGVTPPTAPIAAMDLDSARLLVETKLIAAVSLVKHAQGRLRVGGSIALTSGIVKDRPAPGGSVVAAVAGSLGYLARALALELAPTRVNVVSPGWVDTPMWDAIAGEAKRAIWEQMAARLPAKRIGAPDDIAHAYIYLMESQLTTGEVLHVDGGHRLI